MNIVNKIIKKGIDDSIIYTEYVKSVIIDIYSAYAHIFIYEKNMNQLKVEIEEFNIIKKSLKIKDNISSYALIEKVNGDFSFYSKDYKVAISYYKSALNLFEKNNPKIAPVLFNKGCAHFFSDEIDKAKEYLNQSITEYNNILKQKNIYGFTPNVDSINNKINNAKKLLNLIN